MFLNKHGGIIIYQKDFTNLKHGLAIKTLNQKKYFREYVIKNSYTSLLDLGCGTATEYFAYQEEYPELKYLGVDSCKVLYEENIKLNVPMLYASAENTKLKDNHSEVVFARHVLEHQPTFKPILSEMIRLASKVAIHVFFKVPDDDVPYTIEGNFLRGYNKHENLYHNKFNKTEIENFVLSYNKVKSFEWVKITYKDSGLIILMNE